MEKVYYWLLITICLFTSCQQKDPDEFQLFNLLNGEKTGLLFNNHITESDTLNPSNYSYIYNGAGVAIADINNDGLEDVFFAGNMVSNRLYLNKGKLQFEDITAKAGIENDQWCTGVTVVDINTDGLLDFYVCVADKNYTEKGRNLLYINNGDNSFTESAKAYGLDDLGYSTHAAFFDYDLDGDLDAYILTNGIEKFPPNNARPIKADGKGISTDKLYRNNGDNTFTNVSGEAGITIEGYGLGVAVLDINQDGYPDIYCSNDFITNDLLYVNNGDGTFTNRLGEYFTQTSYNGMGMDAADFNNDGLVDLVTVDMLPEDNKRQKAMLQMMNYDKFQYKLDLNYRPQFVRNALQVNNGNGSFSEIGRMAEVYKTDWSWAPLFIDVDNDGLKDLFISNGYARDITDLDYIVYGIGKKINTFGTKESKEARLFELVKTLPGIHIPNYFYKNGGNLQFADKTAAWGIKKPSYSNGSAFADLDNDGDVDLVMNNINETAFIYENRSELKKEAEKNNYIRIKLEGSTLNLQGLGAKVKVRSGTLMQYHEHYLARGYKSSMENVIHLGLGQNTQIDDIEVIWSEGKMSFVENPAINQEIVIKFSEAKDIPAQTDDSAIKATIFTDIATNESGINFIHQENPYIDFKSHPLLQQMYSRNGPGIAVGDIDGNGLDDFYIGGAFQQEGVCYLQVEEGDFVPNPLPLSDKYEDMGALLFDADNDADLDLYVVSGGVSLPAADPRYQDRLYLNDGKGNFQHATDALPTLATSGSCVVAADFDRDNDLDLFVGGRIVPNKYPQPAASYVLMNEGGTFSKKEVGALNEVGLVTSAIWTDFNNDNWVDLLVVGEWMPITFFQNKEGTLVDVTNQSGISEYTGFWNSITAGDFDHDGDMDYVGGNLGLNSQLKASLDEPVSIMAKDFDGNGSYDPVLSNFIQGQNHPVHTRDALINQLLPFRSKYKRYAEYADAKSSELFDENMLNDALQLHATHLSTSLIKNMGNGKFEIKPLPESVQLSPTYGILTGDFNNDQHLDALFVGNLTCTELVSGYYDASIGDLLLGDGQGNYRHMPASESGFYAKGEAKGIAQINGQQGSYLLIPKNDGLVQTIKLPTHYSQLATLNALDAYVEIYIGDKVRKIELPYGKGYLSQSSRSFYIPKEATKVLIYDYKGESREIAIEDNSL